MVWDENDLDFLEERAAILEYEAGMPREQAERRALELLDAKRKRECEP
jgi:hypothetical protein